MSNESNNGEQRGDSSSNEKQLKIFECIDYPGYVVNADNALKTLGGLDRIEKAFQNQRNGKLFLNYNPENIFTKLLCSTQIDNLQQTSIVNDSNDATNANNEQSTVATRSSISCLLMKVTKITNKSTNSKNYEASIIGKIDRMYTFKKLADFQYLPMSRTNTAASSSDEAKYDGFYQNFQFDQLNYFKQDLNTKMPLYVLPPFFSRFDDPVNYAFRPEPNKKQPALEYFNQIVSTSTAAAAVSKPTNEDQEATNDSSKLDESFNSSLNNTEVDTVNDDSASELICSLRQERSSQALLITFESTKVPEKPSDKLKQPRSDPVKKCIESLNELFKERPCYLKSVLLCITNFTQAVLKDALPYVAYYFTTGPWRSCWVRYGYDPRKDSKAKIYQMIDYRLRYFAEPEINLVKPKPRSAYHKRKFRSDLSENESEDYKNIKIEETMYKFKADRLPSSRNVFYQICDIEDDEVQALVHNNDGQETECTEKDGWCCLNIQDKCRNIMSAKHEKLFKTLASNAKQNDTKKKMDKK